MCQVISNAKDQLKHIFPKSITKRKGAFLTSTHKDWSNIVLIPCYKCYLLIKLKPSLAFKMYSIHYVLPFLLPTHSIHFDKNKPFNAHVYGTIADMLCIITCIEQKLYSELLTVSLNRAHRLASAGAKNHILWHITFSHIYPGIPRHSKQLLYYTSITSNGVSILPWLSQINPAL